MVQRFKIHLSNINFAQITKNLQQLCSRNYISNKKYILKGKKMDRF